LHQWTCYWPVLLWSAPHQWTASLVIWNTAMAKNRVIEIRSYQLKPGTRVEFHRLVSTKSIPLVKRFGIDVVAYGPSRADDDGYLLIRAYETIAELNASHNAFYSSDAWCSGPREAILSLIVEHIGVVLELDEAAIDMLRLISIE
jgi:hypothetical protein